MTIKGRNPPKAQSRGTFAVGDDVGNCIHRVRCKISFLPTPDCVLTTRECLVRSAFHRTIVFTSHYIWSIIIIINSLFLILTTE